MLIYKITNNINNKVYVGQTIQKLSDRWDGHKRKCKVKTNTPIYCAMNKYGIENFMIEEIGGANNITELNYQEWLLIHKNDTLWPNGYNMMEGGGSGGKRSQEYCDKLKIRVNSWYKTNVNGRSKPVINIKTGKTYKHARECSEKSDIKYSTLRSKLNGTCGNNTNFRYLGEENKSKPWIGRDHGLGGPPRKGNRS